jgi:hypothetical protein
LVRIARTQGRKYLEARLVELSLEAAATTIALTEVLEEEAKEREEVAEEEVKEKR